MLKSTQPDALPERECVTVCWEKEMNNKYNFQHDTQPSGNLNNFTFHLLMPPPMLKPILLFIYFPARNTLSHSHHTHTLSLPFTQPHTHAHANTHTHTHILSLLPTTRSVSLFRKHTFSCALSLSLPHPTLSISPSFWIVNKLLLGRDAEKLLAHPTPYSHLYSRIRILGSGSEWEIFSTPFIIPTS